jgi:hypothetical protein
MGIAKYRVSLFLLFSTRLKLSFSKELLCFTPPTSVRNNEIQKKNSINCVRPRIQLILHQSED